MQHANNGGEHEYERLYGDDHGDGDGCLRQCGKHNVHHDDRRHAANGDGGHDRIVLPDGGSG
ncbi:MAG: hypothetical protein RMK74_17390 [Myxococcales bacterium]|nr:hypothetical protein [Myxococcales bacterium]